MIDAVVDRVHAVPYCGMMIWMSRYAAADAGEAEPKNAKCVAGRGVRAADNRLLLLPRLPRAWSCGMYSILLHFLFC